MSTLQENLIKFFTTAIKNSPLSTRDKAIMQKVPDAVKKREFTGKNDQDKVAGLITLFFLLNAKLRNEKNKKELEKFTKENLLNRPSSSLSPKKSK